MYPSDPVSPTILDVFVKKYCKLSCIHRSARGENCKTIETQDRENKCLIIPIALQQSAVTNSVIQTKESDCIVCICC